MAIGDFPAQMPRGFVREQSAARVPAALPRLREPGAPRVLRAVLSAFRAPGALPTSQGPGHAEKSVSFNDDTEGDSYFNSFAFGFLVTHIYITPQLETNYS